VSKKKGFGQRKITSLQATVLRDIAQHGSALKPRGTLQRLEKKGLVYGNRRTGWSLTSSGKQWLKEKQ